MVAKTNSVNSSETTENSKHLSATDILFSQCRGFGPNPNNPSRPFMGRINLHDDHSREVRVQIEICLPNTNSRSRKQKSFSYRKFGRQGALVRSARLFAFVKREERLPDKWEEYDLYKDLELKTGNKLVNDINNASSSSHSLMCSCRTPEADMMIDEGHHHHHHHDNVRTTRCLSSNPKSNFYQNNKSNSCSSLVIPIIPPGLLEDKNDVVSYDQICAIPYRRNYSSPEVLQAEADKFLYGNKLLAPNELNDEFNNASIMSPQFHQLSPNKRRGCNEQTWNSILSDIMCHMGIDNKYYHRFYSRQPNHSYYHNNEEFLNCNYFSSKTKNSSLLSSCDSFQNDILPLCLGYFTLQDISIIEMCSKSVYERVQMSGIWERLRNKKIFIKNNNNNNNNINYSNRQQLRCNSLLAKIDILQHSSLRFNQYNVLFTSNSCYLQDKSYNCLQKKMFNMIYKKDLKENEKKKNYPLLCFS